MKTIYFKFNGGKIGSLRNQAVGWLAVGVLPTDQDGTPLLSQDCVAVWEIEERAEYLKKLIDAAVNVAKKKLPK